MSLRLRDPKRDTGALLTDFGLETRRSWRAGEPRSTPQGMPLEGSWPDSYATGQFDLPEDRSLEACLDHVLRKIEPVSTRLTEFVHSGGSAELFIGFHVAGNSGATIDSRTMKQLSNYGLALAFDIYGEGLQGEGSNDA